MNKKEILNQYNEQGICSYEYVVINGIKQYIQIRGEKRDNPVLLFLHGGPGGAISGLCHVMQDEWEKHYTVVNFDQRNSGKTYLANKDKAIEVGQTGSVEDYANDIDEVIGYLHTKLDFEKIFLMGFSWGSVIGAEYAKRHPENVQAYIGVGQLVNYEKAYRYICDEMLIKAEKMNRAKDVSVIKGLRDGYPSTNKMTKERMKQVRTFAMLANKYLVKHSKAFPLGAILSSPFMKFKEKKAMFLSDISLYEKTYETMLSYDFTRNMSFEVPVCFITGEEDVNCPAKLLEEIKDSILAPSIRLEIIKVASHMCFYDNKEAFNDIICSILYDL